MLKSFNFLGKIFYSIREGIWNYPEVILGDNSLRTYLIRVYRISIPYSHFFVASLIILIFTGIFFGNLRSVLKAGANILVEGVIMGVDSNGNTQTISKVDPLRASNVQLERDLGELIYEPLIEYEYAEGSSSVGTQVRNILAQDVIKIRQGADYQFSLRKGVFWHDGIPFTADDVIDTFEFVSKLDADNAYIRAIKELRWEKLDNFNIRVCTRTDEDKSCEQSKDNPVLSNFLELISIKIIPAHKIKNVDPSKIDIQTPDIFKTPVGTGRFKFSSVSGKNITLERNDNYYEINDIPKIRSLQFKLFPTFEDGIKALENGEIHTLSSVTGEFKNSLEEFPQINVNLSPVLSNQFWSLYFNLRTDPNGNAIASPFFQDKNVRQAISMGINRDSIVNNALQGVGEEAISPIPKRSEFFNKDTKWYRYDPKSARELLEAAGWTLKAGSKIRTNESGEELTFSLYFVDSFDRSNVARSIQNDLESIGVKAIVDRREQPGQDSSEDAPRGWTLNEINNQYLLPRTFDAILYGMYTFIDPDRYELFHSSQISDPGLNISGYVGSVESVKIRPDRKEGESELIRVPRVDRLLEETRAFDPVKDADRRTQNYNEIQDLIAEDAPLVLLYHPQFIYYSHTDVKNVDLKNVTSIEDRFRNIKNWEID